MKRNVPSRLPFDWPSESCVIATIPSLTANRTRLAVLSDLHVTVDGRGSWKGYHQTSERLATALSSATKREIDAVLLSGDLTRDGDPREFEAVFDKLEELSVPFVYVPGNHDVSGEDSQQRERTVSLGGDTDVTESFPFVRRINDIDILGLNSMDTSDHDVDAGAISQSQINQLTTVLEGADNPIVVVHHPLTSSWRRDTALEPEQFRLANARAVLDTLRAHDVPLVISGHVHWPLVGAAGQLCEVVSPAVCSYPQAYLLIDVTPEGTTVSMNLLPDNSIQRRAYQRMCEHQPLDGLYAQAARSDYISSLFSNS